MMKRCAHLYISRTVGSAVNFMTFCVLAFLARILLILQETLELVSAQRLEHSLQTVYFCRSWSLESVFRGRAWKMNENVGKTWKHATPWTPCSVHAVCFNGNSQGLQRLREELLRADKMLLAGEEALRNEAANANCMQQLVTGLSVLTLFWDSFCQSQKT